MICKKCKTDKTEAAEGRVLCTRHLSMAAARSKRSQDKKQAAGLCRCGRTPVQGRLSCKICISSALKSHPRKIQKPKVIALLGGKCVDCGYSNPDFPGVFDLHHIDPSVKDGGIAYMMTNRVAWEIIEEEVKKCVLLCANCHRIRHAKESQ